MSTRVPDARDPDRDLSRGRQPPHPAVPADGSALAASAYRSIQSPALRPYSPPPPRGQLPPEPPAPPETLPGPAPETASASGGASATLRCAHALGALSGRVFRGRPGPAQ
ncbi:hypothetical protein NN561_019862 [Cricetulus griseus]